MSSLIGGQDIPGLVVWTGFHKCRGHGRALNWFGGVGLDALRSQILMAPQKFGTGGDNRRVRASGNNGWADIENAKESQDDGEE